jgi:hypothetical protein
VRGRDIDLRYVENLEKFGGWSHVGCPPVYCYVGVHFHARNRIQGYDIPTNYVRIALDDAELDLGQTEERLDCADLCVCNPVLLSERTYAHSR